MPHSSHVSRVLLALLVAATVSVAFAACGGGSTQVGPSSVTEKPPEVVAPGTTVFSVPVAGTDKAMTFWLPTLLPEIGAQLTVGAKSIVYTQKCTIPFGYTAFVTATWVMEGKPDEGGGGSSTRCDELSSMSWKPVTAGSPGIKALRFNFWIRQGGSFFPEGPPDAVREIVVNWKAPA